MISRKHAEVLFQPGDAKWIVRDLNSTNGVLVNGVKISTHELQDGDQISFGGGCNIALGKFVKKVQSIYRFKFQRLATAALQEAEQHHSEGASGNSEGGNGNAEEPRSRAEETQSRAEEAGVEGREREDEDVENDNSQQRARSGRRDGEKKRRESGEGQSLTQKLEEEGEGGGGEERERGRERC